MKTSDADLLFVPGLGGSGPTHWQSRWTSKLSTAFRVEQADWDRPTLASWSDVLAEEVGRRTRPVVLVAHSLGVVAVAHAAPRLPVVRGAFLVAPPDLDRPDCVPGLDPAFTPTPTAPLPFPSVLVGSRNDPYCTYDRAEEFSFAWGSAFVDAGEAGHLNAESGYGPWPEGLMRFAGFLQQL